MAWVGCKSGVEQPTQANGEEQTCVSDDVFFESEVFGRVLQPVCMQCHIREGEARDTDYVLETTVRPDFLEVNRDIFGNIAGLERDGTSIVLLKPLGMEDHGGGAVLQEDSEEYQILKEFVDRLADPVQTCPDEEERAWGEGLELLTHEQTLRKAALLLAGRLPTYAELEQARHGGDDAIRSIVRQMTQEDAFIERMREMYNDVFLTDAYLRSAVNLLDYERYPNRYWYDEADDAIDGILRDATNRAISREPVELVAHILRNDKPFTEVLTAPYVLVNDYSAMAYGVPGQQWPNHDDPRSYEVREVKLQDINHAGVLTTPAWMNRYPTTDTNRNRHRTWSFMRKFLATDILKLAERPIDLTASEIHNPTMNDSQCAVCHAVMDPVAGVFQNWDDDGSFNPPDEGWHPDMRPPGFGTEQMPAAEQPRALAWLAGQAVQDPRFAISTVQTVLSGVTGLELVEGAAAMRDETLREAWDGQHHFVTTTADAFREGGHDLKFVVEEVVLSRYFRAAADGGEAAPGDLELAGTAHLLTPEELNRKMMAITGVHWGSWDGPYLTNRYRLLYGGIDSDGVIRRLPDPNGIMGQVAKRMATEVSCYATARDFVLPPNQRRLFPHVEVDWVPQTPEGFDIDEAQEAIRANIVHLHAQVLGEELAPDAVEVDATYQLWFETWLEGRSAVANDEQEEYLPYQCQADDWIGEGLPGEVAVEYDEQYTVRAWMAVMHYLLTDYHFLHE